MPEWIQINSIEPDPNSDGGCYFAATMYKHGDFKPYLFRTKDYGVTWVKITEGIDNVAFTRVVRADPKRKGLLYAGTETGMYASFNDGDSWQPFQLNLPKVPITDLTIKNDNLIAATQGRSLWLIDDLTPLHQLNDAMAKSDVVLYQPMPTYRMPGYQNEKPKGEGMNHPDGVMVHYFIKEVGEKDTIKLTFSETNGTVIREFSNFAKEDKDKLKVKSGANFFNWNIRYPEGKKFDGMILWDGDMTASKAAPGTYAVRLTAKKTEQKVDFQILKDQRVSSSDADLKAQFDFVQRCNNKASEAHEAIISIRNIRTQLNSFTENLADTVKYAAIFTKVKEIQKSMTNIEEALYQTKAKSGQDLLNFPIRLVNKLLSVKNGAANADFRPTDGQVAVAEELIVKINSELDKFKAIKEREIPALNSLIKAGGVDAILLKKM
jgi:hypothetical protein